MHGACMVSPSRPQSDNPAGRSSFLSPPFAPTPDPLSESLLATITAASATAKTKLIELHNPSAKVELAFTGTL